MLKKPLALLALFICGTCYAQFVNPFTNNRNEFNQKDFISVYMAADQNLNQQLFGYDWVEALNQQSFSTIVELSAPVATPAASVGYVVIETANFNGDNRDDIFYLIEQSGAWNYGATYQNVSLDQEDSLYHFLNPNIPDLIPGPALGFDHSYPCLSKGDFNGDGLPEIAVAWSQDNIIQIQIITVTENGGNLLVTPLASFNDGEISQSVNSVDALSMSCGDLNGDGTDELFVSATESSSTPGVNYDAFIKVYDVSTDGSFTIIPKGRLVYDNSTIAELDIPEGNISYARTTVQGIRPYPTTEAGGTEVIFAAVAIDAFNEFSSFDYFYTYTISASSDLNTLSVEPGPVVSNNGGSRLEFQSPCESRVGDLNGDTQDDIVVLTSSYLIFSYENEALVVKNDGGTGPVLELTNNPLQESNDRFEIGDVNRDGKADIICQSKILVDSPNGHQFFIQAHAVSNEQFTLVNAGQKEFFVESGMSLVPYGFALGNLDGNDLCLGDPITQECDYYKPLVILEAVPIHFDILNGVELDINNCFSLDDPGACGNLVSFTNTVGTVESSSVQVSSDWAESEELSSGFEYSGFGMSAALSQSYGERFEYVNSAQTSIAVTITAEARSDDFLKIVRYPFLMQEYPVLSANMDTLKWIVAAFPNPNQGSFQDYSSGRALHSYLPSHEIGNILSYPKPGDPDLFYDKSNDPNWLIWDGFDNIPMTNGIGLSFTLTEEASDAFSNSGTTTQSLSTSIGANGFGLGGKLTGTYSESETEVFGQTLSEAESYTISPAPITGDGTWDYDVVPTLYWTRERAAKLAMAVDMSSAGPFWEANYGQQVDPAINLSFKYSYVHFTDYIIENLDRTKSIQFDKINPSTGDTMTANVRIFNYSLMEMSEPVPFSLYHGHPDQGGTLIPDLEGNTLFLTNEILEDQGRDVRSVSFIVTNEMIEGDDDKIYIQLDPNNTLSEIHEDNNLGWTRFGLTCNTPTGTVNIDEIVLVDGAIQFLVFPNPASEGVTIDFSKSVEFLNKNLSIRIMDISGKLVLEERFQSDNSGMYSFNVGGLQTGMYIYQVTTPEQQVNSGKLMIQ